MSDLVKDPIRSRFAKAMRTCNATPSPPPFSACSKLAHTKEGPLHWADCDQGCPVERIHCCFTVTRATCLPVGCATQNVNKNASSEVRLSCCDASKSVCLRLPLTKPDDCVAGSGDYLPPPLPGSKSRKRKCSWASGSSDSTSASDSHAQHPQNKGADQAKVAAPKVRLLGMGVGWQLRFPFHQLAGLVLFCC